MSDGNSTAIDEAPIGYRPCVGVMLVNMDGQVFVGQRRDNPDSDAWQMPQGGIDAGESAEDAALRELHEETGITGDKVTILGELDEPVSYDLPPELVGKLWGGKYQGQIQNWYLMRFHGEDSDIDLSAHQPAEFRSWQWANPEQVPELIVPFKKRVYRIVLDNFRELI